MGTSGSDRHRLPHALRRAGARVPGLRNRIAEGDDLVARHAEGQRRFASRRSGATGSLELDALGRVVAADDGARALLAVDDPCGVPIGELLPPPPGVRPVDHLVALLGAHGDVAGFGRAPGQPWVARTGAGRTLEVDARVERLDAGDSGWRYRVVLDEIAEDRRGDREAPTIDLREPFGDESVVLRYRPVLDLVNGNVVAIVAEVRIQCDDGTLLAPADASLVLDRAGMAGRTGELVVPHALRAVASLRAGAGTEHVRVGVALSAEDLAAPVASLAPLVARLAAALELDPSTLEVEVSDRLALDTMPAALDTLRELRAIGVTVALVDFGAGSTRLDRIVDPPLDGVCIDSTIVARAGESAADERAVEVLVHAARRRGLAVRACGVTSVEQAGALVRFGCTHASGPLFGSALDIDNLRRLLREWRAVPAIATAMVKPR